MNEWDIIEKMGRLPDKIILNPKNRMMSRVWKCSKCKKIYSFEEVHENPAPCECGSIFFETQKTLHPEGQRG